MNILIIGGTRHMGYFLARRMLEEGHRLTLLNRGISPDDLPVSVPRFRCDRTDPQQLRRALAGRSFDVVIDTVLYKGAEAEVIADILKGHVGHYLFLSTGQVYLVREGVKRPFKESDYEGALIPAPEPLSYDYEEWMYGIEKRHAEDTLAVAYRDYGFPYTALRMPMVNGQRDTMNRLYNYVLRIKDGGPILAPSTPNHALRHVYSKDVVEAVMRCIQLGEKTRGKAYNISQDETLSLEEFLTIVGDALGMKPNIIRTDRDLLEANGFLPDCSPFSERWMSELDNTLSKRELGMTYTPVKQYLHEIVAYYQENPPATPAGYRRRTAEKNLVMT
jgi:nucleoside-diphosphate-sugar epimerase